MAPRKSRQLTAIRACTGCSGPSQGPQQLLRLAPTITHLDCIAAPACCSRCTDWLGLKKSMHCSLTFISTIQIRYSPSPASCEESEDGVAEFPTIGLTTAGEPGPKSIKLSSVTSFSTCWDTRNTASYTCQSAILNTKK